MVDRIKQVLEYSQMSTSAFADKIDISRSSLTHIFTGRNQPSLDVAKKILLAFPEISTEWLIMGMGNMLQSVQPQPSKPAAQATTEVSPNTLDQAQFDLFAEASESSAPEEIASTMDADSVKDLGSEDVDASISPVVEPEVAQKSQTRVKARTSETNISVRESKRDRNFNSRGDKKIVQIVFFYEDKSFEIYTPSR